ncbi:MULTISPECIES: hypothetical protein [Calothrix]|nr:MULTISPECIES: hypothetical protein [Calothrix]
MNTDTDESVLTSVPICGFFVCHLSFVICQQSTVNSQQSTDN